MMCGTQVNIGGSSPGDNTRPKNVDRLKSKLKTNKNDRVEVKVVAREARTIGALVVDQRERSKLLKETLSEKPLPVL